MINTSTLKPGLLVSLKTSLTGNVSYFTRVIEDEHVTESGETKERWETEKVKQDAAEDEAGKKARSKARQAIVRPCAPTSFGLVCPEDRVADLEAGLAEARRVADVFNSTARYTRLNIGVLTGRIASDEVEAVKAINSEVRDLLSAMERGIQQLDVKAIRDAADAAKAISAMLSPEASDRVQQAIDAARKQAVRFVKAGEQAAAELDQATIAKITESRAAFLDFDDAREVQAPVEQGLGLDLMPQETESDCGHLAYNDDGSLAESGPELEF